MARATVVLACACALLSACTRGPRSAAQALTELRAALGRSDYAAAYDALDEKTRGLIQSTCEFHQQALATIEESYPAAMQEHEKSRFLDAQSAGEFAAAYEAHAHLYAQLKARLPSLGETDCTVGAHGRWGYAGLRAQWEDINTRAWHDLDTVRENANTFAKAAR